MTYTRKTADEWQVHINYGDGFEEVHAANTRKEARDVLTDYRKNSPQFPAKMIKRRVPIEPKE